MPYLSLPHLLLAATMASAPTSPRPARDAAPTAADGEQARSAAARAHYSARRYREAAQTYEQLYRDTRSTKYLFNAGMARAAAEHDGAAIFHWKTYLAISPDVTAADRTVLAGEIAAAQRRTLPVQLRLDGPLAPATLTLRAPDGAPQGPRDPLDLPPAAAIDLSLEAGSWIATLARPGRPDIVASFRVAADAEPVITLAEPSESAAPASNLPGNLPGDLAGNLPGDLAGNLPDDTPGTLTIRFDPLRAPARGIHLQLDGPQPATRRVRERALSLLLPPGDWTVHASARDREPAAAAVTLGPGDTQRLQLHLPRTHDARVRLGLGLGLGEDL